MDKQAIVELLKDDMRGEHQAIVQYLSHAYAVGEGEEACEIEAIAREEMRHLDWLADAIMELGGDPTMERAPVDFGRASPADQMLKNAALEKSGIAQYRAHIEAIDDKKIQRLLARILHDEIVHKGQFNHLAETFGREQPDAAADEPAQTSEAPAPVGPPARVADILNQGIRHEYSVVLQYLYHSFVTDDKEVSEELQNTAINEMQHMGWLAEEMEERGGSPDMSHLDLVLSRDMAVNLEADIAIEREVTEDYTQHLSELDDDELEELVARIRDHEIYHEAIFRDLLDEVLEEQAKAPESASEDEPKAPQAAPPPEIPSVGTLID